MNNDPYPMSKAVFISPRIATVVYYNYPCPFITVALFSVYRSVNPAYVHFYSLLSFLSVSPTIPLSTIYCVWDCNVIYILIVKEWVHNYLLISDNGLAFSNSRPFCWDNWEVTCNLHWIYFNCGRDHTAAV